MKRLNFINNGYAEKLALVLQCYIQIPDCSLTLVLCFLPNLTFFYQTCKFKWYFISDTYYRRRLSKFHSKRRENGVNWKTLSVSINMAIRGRLLHPIFAFIIKDEYILVILAQRRRKLESMEKGDDLDTVMAKLIDQAAKCNIQRFHCAIELKVKLLSGSSFLHLFRCFIQ